MYRPPSLSIVAAAILLESCGAPSHDLLVVPATRQTMSQTVTASGSLAAQDTILVGSQVSGTIQNIYVDYNSRVRRGQVLARLDPSSFEAELAQAKAALAQAEAQSGAALENASGAQFSSSAARQTAASQREQISAADDAVTRSQSALALAMLTLQRDRQLLRQGFVAQNAVDNDSTAVAAAHAAWTAAKTQAASARLDSSASAYQAGSSAAQASAATRTQEAGAAAVEAAHAAVEQAQLNLDHATIVSPVDGTVIARNVSVGQTVAAALQAPTLFTIAKDLGKMELDISVGEPDVGSVRAGQHVTFAVLAYPGRKFTSIVSEVRQNPTVVNNVTTYDTVAYPSNADGALRPGMTANVRITVATFAQALVVPLSSLQWRPSALVGKRYTIVAPPAAGSAVRGRSVWGPTSGGTDVGLSPGSTGRVYVLAGRTLRGASLRILAVDGAEVAVQPIAPSVLESGDATVIDENVTAAAATSAP
jgi:HlyD family secretion protein